jgi:crotonobetainyl-CoA:carnitine CoA-transferase CaiB-like acyl-CoA transferase
LRDVVDMTGTKFDLRHGAVRHLHCAHQWRRDAAWLFARCALFGRAEFRRRRLSQISAVPKPERNFQMNDLSTLRTENPQPDLLTKAIQSKLNNPERSSNFNLHGGVDQVLKDVGMSTADSGGNLTFYGLDPIIPSPHRFGTMAAIGLAAKAVAVAALWRDRTGEGQDIAVDVRKALRRFCGFFDLKWETINGRPPALLGDPLNPFFELPLFRETRDGRHVVALNIYPKLAARTLSLLKCGPSAEAVQNAIRQWRADDLENAGAEAGIVMAKVQTFEEFRKEPQYNDVLCGMPLITVEKIGKSEPIPFSKDGKSPLAGIRAFGMGHVIAGAGMGRDLAQHGADVLNLWRPGDTEVEAFAWDVQVGMRQTILDNSAEDRPKFDRLLKDADVFFANKRPGYLERYGLDAEELCAKKPGLIHAHVVLHSDKGPWKNRPGFDEIGGAVTGLFCVEGTATEPKSPPIIPICDNVVGWLGTVGILAALRRRAVEGGSYRVTVSLTRTLLWLFSLGIFDKDFAQATAGSSEEYANVAPDLFTAETPLGTYQGITERILSRTPCLLPNGAGAARLEQTRMAGALRARFPKRAWLQPSRLQP